MINDPIVEEIRRVRAKLLDECHGDLGELLDRYKPFIIWCASPASCFARAGLPIV